MPRIVDACRILRDVDANAACDLLEFLTAAKPLRVGPAGQGSILRQCLPLKEVQIMKTAQTGVAWHTSLPWVSGGRGGEGLHPPAGPRGRVESIFWPTTLNRDVLWPAVSARGAT